jgi:signal transduction histidine kinase
VDTDQQHPVTDELSPAPRTRVPAVSFPWLSPIGSLAAIAYLLLATNPELAAFYRIPSAWLQTDATYVMAGGLMLLLLLDVRHYQGQHAHQRAALVRLRQQVAGLWDSRKQLQLKAQMSSGNADKLKRFISDKLLEYIEYDEKFLHFRSIATEVRHNGAISFDKVQTALRQAAASTQEPTDDYQAALDAMRYLWDLLDLSTADNLALHIGNRLCECEEHYYLSVLQTAEPPPFDVAYRPQRAAWRALALVTAQPLPAFAEDSAFTLDDGHWHVRLEPTGELLGNENHLVLLLENLLRNAQFFSRKRGYRSPFAPVSLTLAEAQGEACIRVYNRGPHIADEDREKVFQLGFSTRRAREHHGRGVGLHFASEIVKGYEGRIVVHNIHTPEAQYAIRIELENGDVVTDVVHVVVHDDEPCCLATDGSVAARFDWTLPAPLRSVEVTAGGSQRTQRIDELSGTTKCGRFDPANPERPRWRIDYHAARGAHQLSFSPLAVKGVEFEVRLPTAQQRLIASEHPYNDDIDAEVERLNAHFRVVGER